MALETLSEKGLVLLGCGKMGFRHATRLVG